MDASSERAGGQRVRTRDRASWMAALLALATSAVVVAIAALVATVASHR
jgi:hypothetical protein